MVEKEIYSNPDLLQILVEGQIGFNGTVLERFRDDAFASKIKKKGAKGFVSNRMNADRDLQPPRVFNV
jgi:hypothetical protein